MIEFEQKMFHFSNILIFIFLVKNWISWQDTFLLYLLDHKANTYIQNFLKKSLTIQCIGNELPVTRTILLQLLRTE